MGARLILLSLIGMALLSGCATARPLEHDVLAKPGMQLDSDPMISGADAHMYFSREASKGGQGYGGGGCGCN
jgi:hypothetical protein